MRLGIFYHKQSEVPTHSRVVYQKCSTEPEFRSWKRDLVFRKCLPWPSSFFLTLRRISDFVLTSCVSVSFCARHSLLSLCVGHHNYSSKVGSVTSKVARCVSSVRVCSAPHAHVPTVNGETPLSSGSKSWILFALPIYFLLARMPFSCDVLFFQRMFFKHCSKGIA